MTSTEEGLEGLLDPPAQSSAKPESTSSSNSRKRARVEEENSPDEMMDKITRHCSCTVCLDVPGVALYQCKNGHLMCYTCLNHLLADARLKEEQSTCPNCRCEISMERCMRNLAAEKG
ncbi:Oidioi.mRNA.OKI2018_I69.PAR.g12057.t1.cds [Oikopleura dioica]|uniref:Oidioi.mRNA.OKI2018_I69.PAR.g12057.t1.cds n=1 Tax=Oikopleura dioica TaxID=34765 RepID=A0ABN7S5Z4_OIKDI|nr:Oidioi.mRNA.OKI2018_I69.PAR.g12057.t1.cds [Oikopleura dioica]